MSCRSFKARTLSMEEEFQPPRRRDHHIAWFMHRKHILLWATVGITFVLFLALFSLSLRNDSEISKHINNLNTKLFQKSCNNSWKEELDEFKTEIAKDIKQVGEELHTFKDGLMAKADLMLEDVMNLEKENSKITKAITQGMEQLHSVSAALATNRSLTPSVLETLAELKGECYRIAEDVMQMLDVLRNFTEVFCTTCPAHWLQFQKSCYFFSSVSQPWKTAQQSCENEGAHLVIVNHWIEQNFLVKHMGSEQVFWIGLSDTGEEGQWIWVDDTPLSLSFWGNGEPNNAGSGEDCATLRFSGKWNDVACSGNEYWICEKKC